MMELLPVYAQVYLYVLTGLMGLVMGSALNCLAWRIVHKEKWSGGRSHCPDCGHALKGTDLVPLFSYLFLKGRCRYCGKKISPRYPIAEAILGIIFLSILLRFDLTLEALQWLILCCCLFCLALVDLEIQIIPDRFHIVGILARFAFLLAIFGPTAAFLSAAWYSLWHGLALGGSILVLSLIMDKVLGKESMGGGDIKLLFVLGLYFTLPECFLVLLLGSVIGIVLALCVGAKKDIAFPFGPALSIAGWLTALFGAQITGWYLSLF